MGTDQKPSRRSFVRFSTISAARFAALSSLPVVLADKAQASGRHSDFLSDCLELIGIGPVEAEVHRQFACFAVPAFRRSTGWSQSSDCGLVTRSWSWMARPNR